MEPTIIYEDNHLLAINEPAGELVQGDRTGDPTLTDWGKEYLREKYAKPGAVFLTPAHRLDRPVSGAVLFARTDKALSRLTALFRERAVQKTYWALVLTAPAKPSGELRHYLWKDEQRNIVQAFPQPRPESEREHHPLRVGGPIRPTAPPAGTPAHGRPHQIRVQLAAMGCPILGDLKVRRPLPHCRMPPSRCIAGASNWCIRCAWSRC